MKKKIFFVIAIYKCDEKKLNLMLKFITERMSIDLKNIIIVDNSHLLQKNVNYNKINGSNNIMDISAYSEGFNEIKEFDYCIFINDSALSELDSFEKIRRIFEIILNLDTPIPLLMGDMNHTNIYDNTYGHSIGYIRTNLFCINYAMRSGFISSFNAIKSSPKIELLKKLHCSFYNKAFSHYKYIMPNISEEIRQKKAYGLAFEQNLTNTAVESGVVIGLIRGVKDRLIIKIKAFLGIY